MSRMSKLPDAVLEEMMSRFGPKLGPEITRIANEEQIGCREATLLCFRGAIASWVLNSEDPAFLLDEVTEFLINYMGVHPDKLLSEDAAPTPIYIPGSDRVQ